MKTVKKLKDNLEQRLKEICLKDVDLVLIKEPYIFDRLSQLKLPDPNKRIGVMMVKDFDDLKTLSEKDLNGLGWYKRTIEVVSA